MPSHPIAFLDESWIQHPGTPGAYLIATVLVEQEDLDAAMQAARRVEQDPYGFHATEHFQRGHHRMLEDMLDTVQAHAGWTYLSVYAPLTGDRETARQACLTDLLPRLNDQRVRDVVLDRRASKWSIHRAEQQGETIGPRDLPDVRTYRRLIQDGVISTRMRLRHINDVTQPGLWLADVVAWAGNRALQRDDMHWWNRINANDSVIDAVSGSPLEIRGDRAALPAGERSPQGLSQSAQDLLSPRQHYPQTGETKQALQPGILGDLIAQARHARAAYVTPALTTRLIESIDGLTTQIAALNERIGSARKEPTARMPATEEPLDGHRRQTDVHPPELQ